MERETCSLQLHITLLMYILMPLIHACLLFFSFCQLQALFMPYDHKNTTPNGASAHLMRSVLENLNHRHFQDSCLVGSGGGSVGYVHVTCFLFSFFVLIFLCCLSPCEVRWLYCLLFVFLSFPFADILHMGPRLITCMILQRCQCRSPLRSDNLLSLFRVAENCMDTIALSSFLLIFRYMEMRKHLLTIASKCSILLTRQHSTYGNLASLYLQYFFSGVISVW